MAREIPGGLGPNVKIINQSSSCANNDLTGRRASSGRQWLVRNCTFNDIEGIPISDGDTPVHMAEVALDHIESAQAVHQDDSGGTKKRDTKSWHRVLGVGSIRGRKLERILLV